MERKAEMRGAGWMRLAVKVGLAVLEAAILMREAGSISETDLCEISLTDPSRWEMEYVRTCAAYTGKQVFLINVLRHTHINYKTLPKALRTQVLTALTSNFGLVGLVQYAWHVWFGGFGLASLVW